MASSKNVIKFNLMGITYELPAACLRTTTYNGTPLANPYISIGRKEVPLMFKQFMKAKYPNMLAWGKSSTFANGSSSDLYDCNADGS